MELQWIVENAVNPALGLLPKRMDTPEARVQLLATGLQESRFEYRYQLSNTPGVKGPARGFWQFEKGSKASHGGVWGVYLHRSSSEPLRLLCRAMDCSFDPVAIWSQLEHDDILAAGVARLLLWTEARCLPSLGDCGAAWDYYIRTWNPGKPKPDTWADCYHKAFIEVTKGEFK